MANPAMLPRAGAPPDPSQTASTSLVKRDAAGRIVPGSAAINPGGRPKGLAARVREIVDFDQAIKTLVDIAWGPLAPAARIADRIKAIELLFDRGHGKPQLSIDVKDSSQPGSAFKGMPIGDLVRTVEAMRALSSKRGESDVEDAELVQ